MAPNYFESNVAENRSEIRGFSCICFVKSVSQGFWSVFYQAFHYLFVDKISLLFFFVRVDFIGLVFGKYFAFVKLRSIVMCDSKRLVHFE